MSNVRKSKQGFAALSEDRKREIASMGGRASAAGAGHKWTTEEAREAGKKGGCHDKERMRELGRKGGLAKKKKIDSN